MNDLIRLKMTTVFRRCVLSFALLVSMPSYANDLCDTNPDDLLCQGSLGDLFGKSSEANDPQYPDGALEERDYGIFSDEGDHFKELVEKKKYLSASILFNKVENSYFNVESTFGDSPIGALKHSKDINTVAQHVIDLKKSDYDKFNQSFDTIVQLLKNQTSSLEEYWQSFSNTLSMADNLRDYYGKHHIIRYVNTGNVFLDGKTANMVETIIGKRNRLEREIREYAPKSFDAFDFSSGRDFFENYPVKVDEEAVVKSSKVIFKWIEKADLDGAIDLIEKYKLKGLKDITNTLAAILLDKSARAAYGDKHPTFSEVLATIDQIEDFLGTKVDTQKMPKRYRARVLVFNKNKDLANLKRALLIKEEPYLILIDKRKTSVLVQKGMPESIQSKYVSHKTMVSNPEYQKARLRYEELVSQHNSAVRAYEQLRAEERLEEQRERDRIARDFSSVNCSTNYYGSYANTNCSNNSGWGGIVQASADSGRALGRALSGGGASGRALTRANSLNTAVQRARSRLNNIPVEVEKSEYSEYVFTTRKYTVIKELEYVGYTIDKPHESYVKTIMPLTIEKNFVVADGLHAQDSVHKLTDFQIIEDINLFISSVEELPSDYSIKEDLQSELSYTNIDSLVSSIKGSHQEKGLPLINTQSTKNANIPVPTYLGELERIKSLLDKGVITKEDFDILKEKIINKM